MSLFNDALTWEELENSEDQYEKLKEQYKSISDYFFQLVRNILDSENIENKDSYLINAIDGYNMKLMEMFQINVQTEEEVYGNYPQQPMPEYRNQMMQQQQGFSKPSKSIAAFSMKEYYNKTRN